LFLLPIPPFIQMQYRSTCLFPKGSDIEGRIALLKRSARNFAIHEPKVRQIAQIVHDADLGDDKFGRVEGQTLERVLNGWTLQSINDDELMKKGMELIEGLYDGLS
jgi:hypothetical protein